MNKVYADTRSLWKNPIRRFDTSCCALCQLSVNNDHTKEEIERVISIIKEETKKKWTTNNRDGGERAIFIIISPGEDVLEKNLIELGFVKTFEFNRRNGYPEGILKHMVLSW